MNVGKPDSNPVAEALARVDQARAEETGNWSRGAEEAYNDALRRLAEVVRASLPAPPEKHEPVYRMGDDFVPQSEMRKWHNDRGLPWGNVFYGPEPVTMSRMARSVLGNTSLHYYNEHGGPDVPFEQVSVMHMIAHMYGRFRKGQAHYHEEPPA